MRGGSGLQVFPVVEDAALHVVEHQRAHVLRVQLRVGGREHPSVGHPEEVQRVTTPVEDLGVLLGHGEVLLLALRSGESGAGRSALRVTLAFLGILGPQ